MTHQGRLIRIYRLKRKLTQLDLSNSFGFTSSQFISNIEHGKSPIPTARMKAFSKKLGLPLKKILEAKVKDARDDILKLL